MVEIKPDIDEGDKAPVVVDAKLLRHFQDGRVSISLKYYRRACECFGEWQPRELKKFSAIIEKILGYDANTL